MLVKAGGDGAVMLDLVEKALDEVATLVEARTEGGRIDAMVERSDVGGGALGGNHRAQRIAVVAAIGQHDAFARQCAKHVLGALAVVRLPLAQLERDLYEHALGENILMVSEP